MDINTALRQNVCRTLGRPSARLLTALAVVGVLTFSSLPSAFADLPLTKVAVSSYPVHSYITALSFSADGRRLAVGLKDGRVGLFDVAARTWALWTRPLNTDGIETVAVSPDGRFVAAGGSENKVLLVETKSGRLVTRLPVGSEYKTGVLGVAFSPDGRLLAACAGGRLSDTDELSEQGEARVWTVPKTALYRCFVVGTDAPRNVGFSGDGSLLAVGGNYPTVWSVKTGKLTGRVESLGIFPATLSPDGQLLATSGGLYDLKSRRVRGDVSGQLQYLAFSRTGKLLVGGSTEDGAAAWDGRTGERLADLDFFDDYAALSPDGRLLAGSSYDNALDLVSLDEAALRRVAYRLTTTAGSF